MVARSLLSLIRLVAVSAAVIALTSCGDDPPYFIPGSATLPSCTEAPAFDLNDSQWFDNGVVTIATAGCVDAQPGEELIACSLTWVMTQTDSDLEIIVDEEYRILGRLCGAELHLEGGWWLPVQDGNQCTYEDDSAAEVGIQMQGSTLTVAEDAGTQSQVATGTLALRGPCEATYDMTLTRNR